MKFILYLIRWQLSSPILFACLCWLPVSDKLYATIIANLIGGCLFYFVDKLIFTKKTPKVQKAINEEDLKKEFLVSSLRIDVLNAMEEMDKAFKDETRTGSSVKKTRRRKNDKRIV